MVAAVKQKNLLYLNEMLKLDFIFAENGKIGQLRTGKGLYGQMRRKLTGINLMVRHIFGIVRKKSFSVDR